MQPWAQWFIDHNLRFLLYFVAAVYVPVAIVWHIAVEVMPELISDISRDFKSISNAKKRTKL